MSLGSKRRRVGVCVCVYVSVRMAGDTQHPAMSWFRWPAPTETRAATQTTVAVPISRQRSHWLLLLLFWLAGWQQIGKPSYLLSLPAPPEQRQPMRDENFHFMAAVGANDVNDSAVHHDACSMRLRAHFSLFCDIGGAYLMNQNQQPPLSTTGCQ